MEREKNPQAENCEAQIRVEGWNKHEMSNAESKHLSAILISSFIRRQFPFDSARLLNGNSSLIKHRNSR